jgi:farnesyl diphosphate synthase
LRFQIETGTGRFPSCGLKVAGNRRAAQVTDSGSLERMLADHAREVDALLAKVLAPRTAPPPTRLLSAMRHAVLNGGKRLRPFILAQSAALFGHSGEGVLRAGAALECLHCYSLVHDDLPAMDDDDLRRGQPTVHRAFDEATAILAGDCLQSLAFEIVAGPGTHPDPAVRAELVKMLAVAAGGQGMAGGQSLDLEAERGGLAPHDIEAMQAMKTGALFRFACEAGAVIASADDDQRDALARFGERIGTVYQLADDILDVTSTASAMGKRTAKDAGRGKATLVALEGTGRARTLAQQMAEDAVAELEQRVAGAGALRETAHFMVHRKS